jgi:hypothetical protein
VVFSRYSTNKTDRHDITEILLNVALNTITLTPSSFFKIWCVLNDPICQISSWTDKVKYRNPWIHKKNQQHLNNKEYCNSRCMMQILKLGRQTKQKKPTQRQQYDPPFGWITQIEDFLKNIKLWWWWTNKKKVDISTAEKYHLFNKTKYTYFQRAENRKNLLNALC